MLACTRDESPRQPIKLVETGIVQMTLSRAERWWVGRGDLPFYQQARKLLPQNLWAGYPAQVIPQSAHSLSLIAPRSSSPTVWPLA